MSASKAVSAPAGRRAPTHAQLQAARQATVADVIAEELAVLFCGINPGLFSGAVGHHFARPGNRFWRVLYGSGFTDRLLDPAEERELLAVNVGITNLVPRVTARASELSPAELRAGAARLVRTVRRHRPAVVAVLGVQAYRSAFHAGASIGRQDETIGDALTWVLPNPSGLQAHYQVPELVSLFAAVRAEAQAVRQ